MPKHDFLTPKAIANRQKSIGLQKLRWYCQMCQKQCRDENGFKCHTSSEGHLRQMRVFAENPHRVLDEFSSEFEKGYLTILSHRHGTKRVKANVVYQEYIADKQHIHMNATCWTTLTGFCMYLGKEGKAIVDETEKGWFIQYIDRDPKALARQMQAEQRQKYELDEEERHKREIEAQVRAAEEQLQKSSSENEVVDNNLVRTDDADKIAMSMNLDSGNLLLKKRTLKAVFSADDDDDAAAAMTAAEQSSSAKKMRYMDIPTSSSSSSSSMVSSGVGGSSRHSSSSSLVVSQSSSSSSSTAAKVTFAEEPLNSKQNHAGGDKDRAPQSDRKDYWLHKNIYVKVVSESLEKGRLFKQKGVVVRVIDRYLAEVDIDGRVYKIDQDDLETVIPKAGSEVLVLNGRYRGCKAELLQVNVDGFNCDLRILDDERGGLSSGAGGSFKGKEVRGVEYEDVSKLLS